MTWGREHRPPARFSASRGRFQRLQSAICTGAAGGAQVAVESGTDEELPDGGAARRAPGQSA